VVIDLGEHLKVAGLSHSGQFAQLDASRPIAAARTQQKTRSKAGLLLKTKLQALQTDRISRHHRSGRNGLIRLLTIDTRHT